jgi:diaminopimelate epimerase
VEFPFLKMHGAANDFVVVDHRRPFLAEPLGELVRRLCDRRRGVGADGVLLLESDPEHDYAMRYFNADGGDADYCGNGARCLARLALELGLGRGGEVRFRSPAGIQSAKRTGDGTFEVRFGRVAAPERRGVEAAGRRFDGWWVMAGVPHFVVEVERVAEVPLAEWGAALRRDPGWGPAGANVDFLEPRGAGRAAMRTYERGVEGETLACGSGAIACGMTRAAAGAESAEIVTAGGDVLSVRWTKAGEHFEVWLEGPAEIAFTGRWPQSPAPVLNALEERCSTD